MTAVSINTHKNTLLYTFRRGTNNLKMILSDLTFLSKTKKYNYLIQAPISVA